MRCADWEAALSAYLAEHRNAALEWGVLDCGRFAAGAVEAMTGDNLLPKGTYSTELGAAKVLRKAGFDTLAEYMDSVLPVTPLAMARRGDVVMSDGALGICIGAEGLFLPIEGAGLVRKYRREWSNAWAVN